MTDEDPEKLLGLLLAAAVALTPVAAQAHRGGSEARCPSALSLGVPLAMSARPAVVLSAGATLAVVSVQVVAAGAGLGADPPPTGAHRAEAERRRCRGPFVTVGTSVVVTAVSAGWMSAAGKALCFVPNEIGASLTHNERITR